MCEPPRGAYRGCPYGDADCRDARVIERWCFLKTAGVGGVKTRAGASNNGWLTHCGSMTAVLKWGCGTSAGLFLKHTCYIVVNEVGLYQLICFISRRVLT
jgi:hypothetical protein